MSEEQLRKLMANARRECAPRVDVTDRVMAAVQLRRREEPPIWPLAWVAVGAAALALISVPVGLELWALLSDPLMGLANEVVWWLL